MTVYRHSADLVVTIPKRAWAGWLEEGDLPGDPWSGQNFYFSVSTEPQKCAPGDRVYVVVHGRLRGYAPLVRVDHEYGSRTWFLVRRGGAVAVTVPQSIKGFQGFRYRWWRREDEVPFPDWRVP